MRQKLVLLLGIAVILLGGLAYWLSTQEAADRQTVAGELLLPGLKSSLNELTQLKISKAGEGNSLTLSRSENGWTVDERSGFPADLGSLRRKLLALSDAALLEAKTSTPKNYAKLGVEGIDAQDAASTQLILVQPGQSTELIIGNRRPSGKDGTYIRRPDEAQSWLASGDLSLNTDPASWLNKDIMNISIDRIASVDVTHADGEQLSINKADQNQQNFDVAGLPEGRELLSPTSGNTIATVLGSLTLDDVVSAVAFGEDQPQLSGAFRTFDGLRIQLKGWQRDTDYFISVNAEYDESLVADSASASADESEGGSSEVADSQTSKEPESADVAAEAADLNARMNGWVFKVASYKFNNLNKRLEDLLRPVAEEGSDDS